MKRSILLPALLCGLALLPSCSPKSAEAPKNVPLYSIGQFYKNKRISGGTFSPDETRLLVTSDQSDILNLYELTIADGSQRQVTSSTVESFRAVDYVPGTTQLLYTADKGGNENNHLFLLGTDGKTTDLTPGESEKASFAGWSRDRKSLYYLSN